MEGYQIFLLILFIIIGLYLTLVTVDIVFVLSFKKIFKNHNKALEVMLQNKLDNIDKLISICNDNELKIRDELIEKYNNIDTKSFSNQESEKCYEARNTLSFLRDELMYKVNKSPVLSKRNDVKQVKENILEMDSEYRKLIAMYNADVLGYNYWIHFLPTRYIYALLKVKNKQIIS